MRHLFELLSGVQKAHHHVRQGGGRSSLRSAMVVHIHGVVEGSEYDPPRTGTTCGGVDGCFRLIWLCSTMPNVFPMDSAPIKRYRDIVGYGRRPEYHLDGAVTNCVGLCSMGPSTKGAECNCSL